MKKKKFTLRTVTDIKVFLLFLLEYIRYPVDRTTLINIVSENTDEIIIDYDGCLGELTDSGHVWFDEVDGESYYMISDSGRMVARELFDTLDEDFREKSLKCATKHLSLAKSGATTKTSIEEVEGTRYKVTLSLQDTAGQLFETALVVSSLSEAEKIRRNFETRPEAVYRGVLFSATGRLEYIS